MIKSIAIVFAVLLGAWASPASAERRALIIAFSDYKWSPLPGVAIDRVAIASTLKDDYKITVIDDSIGTRKKFREKWDDFVQEVQPKDEVIIYYSGHGIDVDGLNYLVPLDAEEPNGTKTLKYISDDLILLRKMIEDIQERRPAISIFIVDACRTNPYKNKIRGTASIGLSAELIERYSGETVILYSADFNSAALDSIPGKGAESGSPFAYVFKSLYPKGKSIPILLFFQYVSYDVRALVSPQDQVPTMQGMGPRNWCLGRCREDLLQLLYAGIDGSRTVVDSRTGTPVPSLTITPPQQNGPVASQLPPNRPPPSIWRSSPPGATPVPPESPPLQRPKNDLVLDSQDVKSIGNVIYIGKTSKLSCTGNQYSVDIPFGCAFFKEAVSVARADGKSSTASIRTAKALQDVNIRSRPPLVRESQGWYGCPVAVLKTGQLVSLKGVLMYQYAGDTFIWGVIDGEKKEKCV